MRADRLVSILMLLQTHGKLSTRILAKTLGVSQRTIFRDIEALSIAGIPIYCEHGAEGGCRLVEDYRTDLTGLNEDESRALLLLNAPGPLDALGIGEKVRSALRKVLAAAVHADNPPRSSPPIFLDWTDWRQPTSLSGSLETLFRAAENGKKVRIRYAWRGGNSIALIVGILGLVAKAGDWYLIYTLSSKVRPIRIAELELVEPVEESFIPAANFNLEAYWKSVCEEHAAHQMGFQAVIRTSSAFAPVLKKKYGSRAVDCPSPDGKENTDQLCLRLSFEWLETARQELLPFGGAVEVLEPLPLRLAMLDYASQIVKIYKDGT